MSSLKDRAVLITGGGSGIGLLMAKLAVKENASHVILWDYNDSHLKAARKTLENDYTTVSGQQVDISNTDQITDAVKELSNTMGPIDIVINNAGIIVGGPFSDLTSQDIERTINVNLLGAMQVTRTLLPFMKKSGTGHIVNIASAAGLIPNPGMSVYAASKWGLIGWSESLRLELQQTYPGIKVTTVEPSFINTGMFRGVSPPLFTPLLQPEDIAKSIIKAVKNDKIHLRAPFTVKLLPFLRGILPTRVFDYVAGKLFGVYRSMDTFTGRKRDQL